MIIKRTKKGKGKPIASPIFKSIYQKEEPKLTENKTNREQELETSTIEQFKAMAKAIIVSMAWSGVELLEKNPAKKETEEKPVDEENKSS